MGDGTGFSAVAVGIGAGVIIAAGTLVRRVILRLRPAEPALERAEPSGTISLAQLPRVVTLHRTGTYRVTIGRTAGRPMKHWTVSGTAESALISLVFDLRTRKAARICVLENRPEMLRIDCVGKMTITAQIAVLAPSIDRARP